MSAEHRPDPNADLAELSELRTRVAAERAARLQAEAADAAKDAYLARLSHEWRTPLSAISAAADVLDGVASSDDPLAREARDIIRRQALSLAGRIDAVLDTTRLIAGRAVLSRCRADLAAAAGQAVAASQAAGLADHCELRLTSCETTVDIDPARVAQAVSHLLANALRFTPAGGEVEVEVGTDAGGPFLQVRDTGPGIDPADIAHFFRGVDLPAGSEPPPHAGLGLRFVLALMAMLGGRCEATASARGTAVTLRFAAPAVERSPASISRADTSGTRRALVIAEDAAYELLGRWLEDARYSVSRARPGEGARPIVAMGLGLTFVAVVAASEGAGTALALVRQARAAGHSGRMVALVEGMNNGHDARALRVAGFDGHLPWPSDRDAFMRGVADE